MVIRLRRCGVLVLAAMGVFACDRGAGGAPEDAASSEVSSQSGAESQEASRGAASDGAASDGAARKVSGAEAKKLVADGAQLLDVRTGLEYGMGHVEGAKNIPIGDLAGRTGELDQKLPVVVYCHSGRRSAKAAELLAARGYEVYDLGAKSDWPEK